MLEVPAMPFYWRFKDVSGVVPGDPPERVPFLFDYDSRLDLLIEPRTASLKALLNDIYSRHTNVGFLQDGHSLVQSYGADFWRFLEEVLAGRGCRTIVEIGCGGCVLLERLKNQGYDVIGIDPSPFAAEAGRRKGIHVLQEFFSASSLDCRPDLIFQVDVLEHVEDPASFLRDQAEGLDEGGLIVVNVPDCTPSIERGDISMALHQHLNMFDGLSLPATFRAAGLEVVKLERSRYGSALYCVGRKAANAGSVFANADGSRWTRFQAMARNAIDRFQARLDQTKRSGASFGFYMPQRAFPYLGTVGTFDGFRVFDNMNMWHRRYLDGLAMPVENHADLVANPVDHVFVMSLTFGKEVSTALQRDVPAAKVTTLDEILG